MDLPTFICAGGAKCGTTSLYEYLKQHPQIFLPDQKELHFFSYPELKKQPEGPGMREVLKGLCKTQEEYAGHYKKAKKGMISGDISPSYLVFPEAIPRMKAFLENPKIIIMLRDPVDRVFSQYMHLRRAAREELTFEKALEAEEQRKASNWGDMWHYTASGFYFEHVSNYINAFGRDNVMVILSHEMRKNPDKILQEVFQFIGVDPNFKVNTSEEFNRSGLPKSLFIARLTDASSFANLAKKIIPRKFGASLKRWIQNLNTGDKEVINPDTVQKLRSLYTEDIKKLETLIGKETGWLKK